MRMRTDIDLKTRRTVTFSDFLGIDLSSSPLDIDPRRASFAKNLINDHGITRKRNGWRETVKIMRSGEAQKINGIFEYIHGERRETIVHAGTRFYRVTGKDYEDITLTSSYADAVCNAEMITDTLSMAFLYGGRLYITGCGDYLVYGTWDGGERYELRRVYDNEDTYVPTTTISIDADGTEADVRSTLDDINCLSSYRKNQLLGAPRLSGYRTWTVDSDIDEGSDIEIIIESLPISSGDEVTEYTVRNCGDDKSVLYITAENGADTTPSECGTVSFSSGQITFDGVSTVPPIEGRDNITVKFRKTNVDYAMRICRCAFGTLFGTDGNTNRIFISGNADYPNMDFYSEADDFTYFSDLNTCTMGSAAVPIMGYLRISDGTLAIYKSAGGREATVYYRTGSNQIRYDESGDPIYIKAVFPTSAGSACEGAVSRHAFANFAGDNIMLSENGVFGIVLSENLTVTDRYVRERSRSINKKLCASKNLSEAYGIVHKNKYYLAVGSECYVADARYKYSSRDDIDGSYNYEWWYWTDVPAYVFAEINGELCFGTRTGSICTFDGAYTDRTFTTTEDGDLSVDTANGRITCNADLGRTLTDGDRIIFGTDGIYALLQKSASVDGGRIVSDENGINKIHEGDAVYADSIGGSGLLIGTRYYISDVDRGECTYTLSDENGDTAVLHVGGFNLYKSISGKTLYAADVHDEYFYLREYPEGEILSISGYDGDTATLPMADITHISNIATEWRTPVTAMENPGYDKTLLAMTVTYEPGINGKLSMGYQTRNLQCFSDALGMQDFSLYDLSFNSFSFDTGFARSYTKRLNERNFNFIVFRITSDDEGCCAINSITVTYKINRLGRGVR